MDEDLARYHIKSYERLYKDANSYYDRCDDIAKLLAPAEIGFNSTITDEVHDYQIMDNFGINAVNEFVNKMTQVLIGGAKPWFDLTFEDNALVKDRNAMHWLEEVKEILYRHLSSPDSNFISEISSVLRSVALFGTGVLYSMEGVEEEDEPVFFIHYPLHQFVFAQDRRRYIKKVYRKFKMTTLEILETFPNIKDELKNNLKQDQNLEKKYDILHCVYPNEEIELLNYISDDKKSANDKKYTSLYILMQGPEILERGGFYELPYTIARWTESLGDGPYPTSPAMAAEANIRILYAMMDALLGQTQKILNPTFITDITEEDIISRMGTPGAILPINRNSRIELLNNVHPSTYPFTIQHLELVRFGIQRAFLLDKLSPIPPGPPEKTATQVNNYHFYNLSEVAAIVNRFYNRFFVPIVERTFNILYRAGSLPNFPIQIEEARMKVQIENPLTQAYKTESTQNIEMFFRLLLPLIQMDPSILLHINNHKVLELFAQYLGVDIRILRPEQEVVALQQEIQKRQEEQERKAMQLQEAQVGSAAARNLSQAQQNIQQPPPPQQNTNGQIQRTNGQAQNAQQ